MKNAWKILVLNTLFSLIALPAFGETSVEVRAIGVSYLKDAYGLLADDFAASNKKFAFNYVGSDLESAGKALLARQADFIVTDSALTRRYLEEKSLLQFPLFVTAIVPVVNIPGLKGEVLLTKRLLAEIMEGKITNWNDKAVRELNPGLSLPSLAIRPIVRAETSSATRALKNYLTPAVSKENAVSEQIAFTSDAMQTVTTGEEVASLVAATPGAISYIEMDLGNIRKLHFVKLKHDSGSIVKADVSYLKSGIVRARSRLANSGIDALTTIDQGQNWPIALPIYVVMKKDAANDEKTSMALKFFFWIFGSADEKVEQWGLVPLPVLYQTQAVAEFRKIRSRSGKLLTADFDLGMQYGK